MDRSGAGAVGHGAAHRWGGHQRRRAGSDRPRARTARSRRVAIARRRGRDRIAGGSDHGGRRRPPRHRGACRAPARDRCRDGGARDDATAASMPRGVGREHRRSLDRRRLSRLRRVGDDGGSTRARAPPATPVRALRRRLERPARSVRVLRRARPREAHDARVRASRRARPRGGVHRVPRLRQDDHDADAVSTGGRHAARPGHGAPRRRGDRARVSAAPTGAPAREARGGAAGASGRDALDGREDSRVSAPPAP